MPELPEVETVRRGLAASLTGRRIAEVVLRRETLREPFPDRFAERLAGRRIEGFDRRGKYLLVHLDDRQVLIAHLGMSGRFAVADAPLGGPHEHVLIRFDEGGVLSYTDHRRFGVMTLAAREALAAHRLLAGMGPEPLGAGFTGAALARRLETKRTPIKAALLDQKTVAGLGNIYICEALFRARLSPRRSAHTVRGKRAERLVTAIKAVLGEAIDSGGSTLRDYAQASGELGYFQHRFQVYDREGEPCPGCDCESGIRRIVQSNRSTFYCAERQR